MKILRYWVPFFAYAGLIFFLSSVPHFDVQIDYFPNIDKLIHFVEYSVMGILCARLYNSLHQKWGMWRWVAIGIGIVYGASDEWHQSFVFGRDSSVWDWVADGAGVFFGVFIYPTLRRFIYEKLSSLSRQKSCC